MDGRVRSVGFALLASMALAPACALAADKSSTLKLGLSSTATAVPARHSRVMRRSPRFQQATPSLSQRALQSLLRDADEDAALVSSGNGAQFQFKRQGDAGREIAAGYNSVCDSVSRKVWDEPAGKRVRFDVAGKPGVALEFPLR